MDWNTVRGKSRDIVHATFSHPAIYTDPVTSVESGCTVRLHNEFKRFGDLDREGFAQAIEEINQAVFDSAQIVPKKNGLVKFVEMFGQPTFEIVNITPPAGDKYIRTTVTLQRG